MKEINIQSLKSILLNNILMKKYIKLALTISFVVWLAMNSPMMFVLVLSGNIFKGFWNILIFNFSGIKFILVMIGFPLMIGFLSSYIRYLIDKRKNNLVNSI